MRVWLLHPPGLPGDRVNDCAYELSVNAGVDISACTCAPLVVGRTTCFATRISQWEAGMVMSAPTNPSLAAGRTRCSHLEIVSQTQMSSWMRHYPSLVVQTGRMTTVTEYAGSSTWGWRFIVIAITHLLAFRALITAIIALPDWCRCRPFSLE